MYDVISVIHSLAIVGALTQYGNSNQLRCCVDYIRTIFM